MMMVMMMLMMILMELGLKKCVTMILKSGNVFKESEGMVLPVGQVLKTIDDEAYRYLGITAVDVIKEGKRSELFSVE